MPRKTPTVARGQPETPGGAIIYLYSERTTQPLSSTSFGLTRPICTGQSTNHTENALLETYKPFLVTCNEAPHFVVNKRLAMYLEKKTRLVDLLSNKRPLA